MLKLLRASTRTSAVFRAHHHSRRDVLPARGVSLHIPRPRWGEQSKRLFATVAGRRQETTQEAPTAPQEIPLVYPETLSLAKALPVVCPGCGAFSQTVESSEPGFYSSRKRNVRATKSDENKIFQDAMARLSVSGQEPIAQPSPQAGDVLVSNAPPICDRCHGLIYQSKGHSIQHPSMQSIQSIIESSPHDHNHIYHVLDAADFPMSLIPNLVSSLSLPRLRTQNRRSKSMRYTRGRVAEISFIITRSDLLAPQKEQVDKLMPYLQEVLRDALGKNGRNVRLGNVRCVSAKRGWWTTNVKQEIWERGGAGWVVGKVNVGKSALFEVVFPKGRGHTAAEEAKLKAVRSGGALAHPLELNADESTAAGVQDEKLDSEESLVDSAGEITDLSSPTPANDSLEALQEWMDLDEEALIDEDSLLPPTQPEMQYPHMPIVSALPGTTASPIRIPFGEGKGELIDLPGIARTSLETHIKPEYWPSLVMKSRIAPEQYTIKPGQSLLLGGIIRITPKTEDQIFLAYPFTPLDAHLTGDKKALAIQTGVDEDGLPYSGTVANIGTDTAKQRATSAGTFKLKWDVTKRRAGALTDKTAGKRKADELPFTIYSADILIEGVGWVELACQVRNRRQGDASSSRSENADPEQFPEVEVFTPKGKFIGIRRPMNAWLVAGPKKVAVHARRARPRMSVSVQKRKEGGKRGSQNAVNFVPS